MKRFKKLFVNLVAVLVLVVSCFSLTACDSTKTLEVKLSLVDKETFTVEQKTLTIDLYSNLAPDTVEQIIKYAKDGYYDNAIFYYNDAKILIGDYAYENGQVVQKQIKPTIDGEFEKNGVKGSNLINEVGAIGLWRTWNASDDYKTNNGFNTGRATWYMPTGTKTAYDGYFCIFAKINLDNDNNKQVWDQLNSIFTNDTTYEEYTVYYTGTFDADKADQNYGLEYNCVLSEDFVKEDVENLFVAEDEQPVAYNETKIRVPIFTDDTHASFIGAKIDSVKVK